MKTIAAFDFDHTLTNNDNLIPFLTFVNGPVRMGFNLIKIFPYALLFLLKFKNRKQVKERFLKLNLNGMSYTKALELGQSYAEKKIPEHLVVERMQLLKWHQDQGHTCVLVSANINLFLPFWSQLAGFNHVISSVLEIENNKITGNLVGENCWGDEKARRLLEWAGPKKNFILYAYGDSQGDEAMLALADHPTKF